MLLSSPLASERLRCVQHVLHQGVSKKGSQPEYEPGLNSSSGLPLPPCKCVRAPCPPHFSFSLFLQDLWPSLLRELTFRLRKMREFSGKSLIYSWFLLEGVEGHLGESQGRDYVLTHRDDATAPGPVERGPLAVQTILPRSCTNLRIKRMPGAWTLWSQNNAMKAQKDLASPLKDPAKTMSCCRSELKGSSMSTALLQTGLVQSAFTC